MQHPSVSPIKPPRTRGKTLFAQRVTGVNVKHSRSCPAKSWDEAGECDCKPTFEPWISLKGKLIYAEPVSRFSTLAAAKTWRTNAEADKNRSKLKAPTKLIFANEKDRMIEDLRSDRLRNKNGQVYKPKVKRDYISDLETLAVEGFGPLELEKIRRKDWRAYANEKLADGLSPNRVKNLLQPAQVLYRRLIDDEDLDIANPLTKLVTASGGRREHVAEIKDALANIEALETEFDRALWASAFLAGPRMGELRGLRLEEDDCGDYFKIERSWDDIEGEILPKSKAGERMVPVCDHLRGYLDAYKATLGRTEGLYFGETATTPFNYGKTTRRAYKVWQNAGLERYTLHEARHSWRSYLDALSGVISEVRADIYAGHAGNKELRKRYVHTLKGQIHLDAAALDEYIEAQATGVVVPIWRAS